jgi:uncharacterized protein with PIN domain
MKFNELIGKRFLGIAQVYDYADWAETLMCDGCKSENIAILVGIGSEPKPETYEVEKYFRKSLDDLNLTLPPEKDALSAYAKSLCSEIISGKTSPSDGLQVLVSFYRHTDYQESLWSIWDSLEEDIALLDEEYGSIFNTNLTKENTSEYIIQVAEQFIEIMGMTLPDNFFNLSSCSKCNYIGESLLESIDKPWMPEKLYRFIYNKGQTKRSICPQCKEPYPVNMHDFQGRKKYLEKFANQNLEPIVTTPVDKVEPQSTQAHV